MQPLNHFKNLPLEVFDNILSFLHKKDIMSCLSICVKWNNMTVSLISRRYINDTSNKVSSVFNQLDLKKYKNDLAKSNLLVKSIKEKTPKNLNELFKIGYHFVDDILDVLSTMDDADLKAIKWGILSNGTEIYPGYIITSNQLNGVIFEQFAILIRCYKELNRNNNFQNLSFSFTVSQSREFTKDEEVLINKINTLCRFLVHCCHFKKAIEILQSHSYGCVMTGAGLVNSQFSLAIEKVIKGLMNKNMEQTTLNFLNHLPKNISELYIYYYRSFEFYRADNCRDYIDFLIHFPNEILCNEKFILKVTDKIFDTWGFNSDIYERLLLITSCEKVIINFLHQRGIVFKNPNKGQEKCIIS